MLASWKKSCAKLSVCFILMYDKIHYKKIKKQRHYFAKEGPSSQSYGFSSSHVRMWEFIQKEGWRTDAFELWCWIRLSGVPWKGRRSNQSVLKEINPEYSLEALMLELKLQYFSHLVWRADLWENSLMLGKTEGMRRRDSTGWDS